MLPLLRVCFGYLSNEGIGLRKESLKREEIVIYKK